MKKFRFRITLAYDVLLTEKEIYPDYPWHLSPEHARRRKHGKRPKLTAAAVEKTVRANGGAAAVFRDWYLATGIEAMTPRTVRIVVKPHTRVRRKKA